MRKQLKNWLLKYKVSVISPTFSAIHPALHDLKFSLTILDRNDLLHARVAQLEREVQRLQLENHEKRIKEKQLENLVQEKENEINMQNMKIEELEKEKLNIESQATQVKNIFRHINIEPLYEQVVDLFAQFYPTEEDIGQYLVEHHGDLAQNQNENENHKEERPNTVKFPEISKSGSAESFSKLLSSRVGNRSSHSRHSTKSTVRADVKSSGKSSENAVSKDTSAVASPDSDLFDGDDIFEHEEKEEKVMLQKTSVGVQTVDLVWRPLRSRLNTKDASMFDMIQSSIDLQQQPSATHHMISKMVARHVPTLDSNSLESQPGRQRKSKTSLGFHEPEKRSTKTRCKQLRFSTPQPEATSTDDVIEIRASGVSHPGRVRSGQHPTRAS